MTKFAGIVPALEQALTKRGYADLTPVQESMLAPELASADALVSAQTGSGKTVAFGLAMAPTILDGEERFGLAGEPLALVIAPTRELALQVKRELEWLYEFTGATIASCVGGMDMRTERRALERGAQIVVGTPGRLRDHIQRNSFRTSALMAVVLDEADEMLDLGFREDLEFILESAPEERRTLMFSATVSRPIAKLAESYQRNAIRVSTAAEREQHHDIEYRALTASAHDRENAIINVLRYYEAQNALVFCNTRATVNHLTARFNNRGFSVVALSGELSQNERTHALQAMRDGRARVCIATDVAARGIDLPNLELVIHADLPTNREALLHRSGRTGRAGRKGVSVLIVPSQARKRTERLLSSANVSATWAQPPSADEVTARDDERILNNEVLTAPLQDEERAFVAEILERHGAEQAAAAFVRLYRSNQSAPEELIDAGKYDPTDTKANKRNDFVGGVWASVSIGHNRKVEARWLLPMLCGGGGVTKRDIGAIKIQQEETFVELSAECVDSFFAAIGPSGRLEDNITIKRLSGKPDLSGDRHYSHSNNNERSDKPFKGKKSFGGAKGGDYKAGGKPKRSFDDKPKRSFDDKPKRDFDEKPRRAADSSWSPSSSDSKPRAPKANKPDTARDGAKPAYAKSSGKAPYAKDTGKPHFSKDGAKPGAKSIGKPKFAKGADKKNTKGGKSAGKRAKPLPSYPKG